MERLYLQRLVSAREEDSERDGGESREGTPVEVEAEIGMLRLGARRNRGQGGKDLPRAPPGDCSP